MGDGSGCPAPAFPELTCKLELPCDPDLPLVDILTVIPDIQTVDVSWIGAGVGDTIEFLITGKFLDYQDDPLVPFYELNDYLAEPDVADGVTGTVQMGAFVIDRVYTVSARRIRDGKVSMWSAENSIGIAGDHTYLIDGVDIMIDDYFFTEQNEARSSASVRTAPTIMIDDEVP